MTTKKRKTGIDLLLKAGREMESPLIFKIVS
jgi:hypothetical protein